MFKTHSNQNRLLACLVAAAICLSMTTSTSAGECGCESACDAFPSFDSAGTCDCSHRSCIYKALDAFAGGFEKMLYLCKCSSGCSSNRAEKVCDDGCDAAMIQELTASEPIHLHLHHTSPDPPHVNSAPIDDHQIRSSAPSSRRQPLADPNAQMRMTKPRIQDQRLGMESDGGPEERELFPPSRIPAPESQQSLPTEPDTNSERKSLFDSLSDPFRDDEAQIRRYRSVRPSSYNELELRPIRKIPLSQNYTISSRRASSVR
jgi:hypothetical protein